MAPRLPDADRRRPSARQTRDLPVPVQRASAHARVLDHAGAAGARAIAPAHVAFRVIKHVGLQIEIFFAAQWLAYALPCQRFAGILTNATA